jgi:predicted nuclease of restriction endonuclease-like RecB superfamily
VRARLDALRGLDTPWQVTPAVEILDLPGHGVCVPDLTFEHAQTGERVHLEVLGYWSRDAVWKRVELVEAGLAHRIVFAVGQHLRVSEAALDAELPAALYVYKRTMSAKAIVERLDALATVRAPRKRGAARP